MNISRCQQPIQLNYFISHQSQLSPTHTIHQVSSGKLSRLTILQLDSMLVQWVPKEDISPSPLFFGRFMLFMVKQRQYQYGGDHSLLYHILGGWHDCQKVNNINSLSTGLTQGLVISSVLIMLMSESCLAYQLQPVNLTALLQW